MLQVGRYVSLISGPTKLHALCRTMWGDNPHCIEGESQNHNALVLQEKGQTTSRPNVFLVYTTTPHTLHSLFSLLWIHSSLRSDNLSKDVVDLTSHIRGVTADVEVSFLLEEFVDHLAIILEKVLDVDLVGLLSGECIENS